jgi:hypothetical protein
VSDIHKKSFLCKLLGKRDLDYPSWKRILGEEEEEDYRNLYALDNRSVAETLLS